MTQSGLILKTLLYYWRTNLAVMLGVAVGTAVIAGALIVGDSVRYSLRQMTLDRLGMVDYALSGGRFFRENLAAELAEKTGDTVSPAILITGTLQHEIASDDENSSPEMLVAGSVNLAGCDERLWKMLAGNEQQLPGEDEIVLNERVAEQLKVQAGDELTLYVNIPSTIPQESLLGERDVDELVLSFPLSVSQIIPAVETLGRFSLQPNQQLPLNAFMNLHRLQSELDLAQVEASRRNPIAKPARVNALLISQNSEKSDSQPTNPDQDLQADPVNKAMAELFTLEDLHLHIREFPDKGYFTLESDRMILERPLSELSSEVADELRFADSPVLVYLVNELFNPVQPDAFSMYSVAAGIELTPDGPFGPFLNEAGESVTQIPDGSVVINGWLAQDLQASAGDQFGIKYHVVGSRGDLPEEVKQFPISAVVQLGETPAADAALTPYVEGITDAESLNDWEQPFPMDMDRITDRDDSYWEAYQTTPKVFLNLKTARDLWQSRYGDTTSTRIAPAEGTSVSEAAGKFRDQFLQQLPITSLGLLILPVKAQGLQAAQGTQDFTGLFIGFSFFVIASAAVLIVLLFRLGIEGRVKQMGLYSAIGFTKAEVKGLLIKEGLVVAVTGILLGMLLGIYYASWMIYGLTHWWKGAIGTSFLEVYVSPMSLIGGALGALFVAVPGIWLGIRQMMKVSPKDRLHGVTTVETSKTISSGRGGKFWIGLVLTLLSLLLVPAVVFDLIPQTEAFGGFNWQIVGFFLSGFGLLTGLLLLAVVWLRNTSSALIRESGIAAAVKLGGRNSGRHRQRSAVTIVLVSLATFVVIAVSAGRQKPTNMTPELYSGNGGFSLVAESARPLLYELTDPAGQQKLGLIGDRQAEFQSLLTEAKVISFRVRPGEDASCLNLYQTRLPTILGVPEEMIERGGFLFADTPGENPWTKLRGSTSEGHIPVIGDMNTLQYSLHKSIGSNIELPPELNADYDLEVVGSLAGSLFQGVLLMSETNFLELFPDVSGRNYFLVETSQPEELTRLLETELVTFGFDVEPTGRRLENFLAVQNTYLSTFQALGGLGLLLGTIGLGTVMLRNVLERRSELALMRAIGFERAALGFMVLAENAFLLVTGLLIGASCAVVAMLPNILSRGGDFSWENTLILLVCVFTTGMIAALFAVVEAVRTPVLQTLRSE